MSGRLIIGGPHKEIKKVGRFEGVASYITPPKNIGRLRGNLRFPIDFTYHGYDNHILFGKIRNRAENLNAPAVAKLIALIRSCLKWRHQNIRVFIPKRLLVSLSTKNRAQKLPDYGSCPHFAPVPGERA